MGRRKIKIEKIERKDYRQVAFSKRRAGLFKKAGELSLLSGAEIAIIVFSPAGRIFSMGHPSVDSVVDRYLAGAYPPDTGTEPLVHVHPGESMHEQFGEVLSQLEAERKRGEWLVRKDNRGQFWWDAPIDDLDLGELEQLRASMEELKRKVEIEMRTNQLGNGGASSSPSSYLAVNPVEVDPCGTYMKQESEGAIFPYGFGYECGFP